MTRSDLRHTSKVTMIGIYKIVSPSGRIYIGQSVNIESRWRFYKTGHCKKQKKLHASLLKHGYDNHLFEVVEICEEKDLNELEIKYIKQYQTFNTVHGLNLDGGGSGGRRSEETKKRISLSKTGKCSEVQRDALVSRNKAGKGRKLSKEQKEKVALASTGRKHTEETKLKMRQSALRLNKSEKFNEEARQKMSVSGKLKLFSAEHKRNLSLNSAKSRSIKVIDTATGLIYASGVEVANAFGLKYDNLKHKLNGLKKNNTSFKRYE